MAAAAGSARDNVNPRVTPEELEPAILTLAEQIRRRAHEIWLQRNELDESEMTGWLQAEVKIRSERTK